jgi:hypothetical protein
MWREKIAEEIEAKRKTNLAEGRREKKWNQNTRRTTKKSK